MFREKKLFGLLALLILGTAAIVAAQPGKESTTKLNHGKYIPDIGTFMQIGANSPAGYSWDGRSVFLSSSMSGAPKSTD